MAMLDTTVFVDLRGRGGKQRTVKAQETLAQLVAGGESLSTSRITVAELYVGIQLSMDPAAEKLAVEEALEGFPILELDDVAARHFANIRAYLRRRSRTVGDMDTLIGGIALANGQPVVTRNPAHFSDMPGLRVITYGA